MQNMQVGGVRMTNHVKLRLGFWVWEGVLTPEGRRQFTASMTRLQQIHDHMVMETDWDGVDWGARGLPPPHEGGHDMSSTERGIWWAGRSRRGAR